MDGGDPNIVVRFTDENEEHCIALYVGPYRIPMHTRSAVDLHHKLGLAILDWIGTVAHRLED